MYIRGDVQQVIGNEIPEQLLPFVQPFDPEAVQKENMPIDYLQEREWRLPKTLEFEYRDVLFVIVKTIDDAINIIQYIGSVNLPEDKFIPMDVYRTIKEAWKVE